MRFFIKSISVKDYRNGFTQKIKCRKSFSLITGVDIDLGDVVLTSNFAIFTTLFDNIWCFVEPLCNVIDLN